MTDKAGCEPQYHSLSLAYQTYLRHDRKEQNHWDDVCRAFRQYASFAMAQWANHQNRFQALPEIQQKVLPKALHMDTADYQMRATQYKEAAIRNQFCLDCVLRHAGMPHSQQPLNSSGGNASSSPAVAPASSGSADGQSGSAQQQQPLDTNIVSDSQLSKTSSVLKSLARDWSVEGKPEREMAYGPLLKQLKQYVPLPRGEDGAKKPPPRVCVPGAGVGRLAFDITALGYSVQGNDFSLFMLLASDFMLNGGVATPENPIMISPWLLESRNVHSPTDPLRIAKIPDVDPYTVLSERVNVDESEADNIPEFSMAAGEFAAIYSTEREQSQWDAVVCSFFLDTAPSIVEYIQIIHDMLKPGGFIISFGPLLYHWSGPAMRPDDKTMSDYHERFSYLDVRYLNSVDLCWEDVREIFINVGFEMVEEKAGVHSLYTADRRSMMNMSYRCVSFVARKKVKLPDVGNPTMATGETHSHNSGGGSGGNSSLSSSAKSS